MSDWSTSRCTLDAGLTGLTLRHRANRGEHYEFVARYEGWWHRCWAWLWGRP